MKIKIIEKFKLTGKNVSFFILNIARLTYITNIAIPNFHIIKPNKNKSYIDNCVQTGIFIYKW